MVRFVPKIFLVTRNSAVTCKVNRPKILPIAAPMNQRAELEWNNIVLLVVDLIQNLLHKLFENVRRISNQGSSMLCLISTISASVTVWPRIRLFIPAVLFADGAGMESIELWQEENYLYYRNKSANNKTSAQSRRVNSSNFNVVETWQSKSDFWWEKSLKAMITHICVPKLMDFQSQRYLGLIIKNETKIHSVTLPWVRPICVQESESHNPSGWNCALQMEIDVNKLPSLFHVTTNDQSQNQLHAINTSKSCGPGSLCHNATKNNAPRRVSAQPPKIKPSDLVAAFASSFCRVNISLVALTCCRLRRSCCADPCAFVAQDCT